MPLNSTRVFPSCVEGVPEFAGADIPIGEPKSVPVMVIISPGEIGCTVLGCEAAAAFCTPTISGDGAPRRIGSAFDSREPVFVTVTAMVIGVADPTPGENCTVFESTTVTDCGAI